MNSAPLIKNEHAHSTNARHYGSLTEFLSAMDATPTREHNRQRKAQIMCQKPGYGKKWYGAESYEAALAIINNGWQIGADKVEASYAELAATLPRALSVRRKRRFSDTGDEINIDALHRYDYSKLWVGYASQLKAGLSAVRIVVDICGHCGETDERLQRQGIAALCLSRILARAGYSVEIVTALAVAGSNSSRKYKNTLVTVTIKSASARPDLQQLAATAAFPGFFRIHGFVSIVQAADSIGADAASSLGHPIAAETLIAPSSRMLQIVTPTFESDAAIKTWLTEAIKVFQGSKR